MSSLKRKFAEVYSYQLRDKKDKKGKEEKKEKKEKKRDKKKRSRKESSDEDEDEDDDDEPLIDLSSLGKLAKKDEDQKIERDCNHVYFYGEVNRENIFDLTLLIKEAEEENILTSHKLNIEKIPIYLHISSYGGSIFDAFTLIDVIKSCKVPIHSIIEGASASAATIISIVAEKRYIRPNGYMLIHQLSSGCWGKMNEIEDEFKNLNHLMDKIKSMYLEHAKIPKKELVEILKHDLWMDAQKCIKYGLIDEIWTN
jgi:ATP-dependent Clp protease protease subunit